MGSLSGRAFDFKIFLRILSYTKPYRSLFYGTLGLTILIAILSPIRPWLVQFTLDHYIIKPDAHRLLQMTLVMFALLLSEAVLQFFDTYLANLLGQCVIKDMRVQLYKHLLNFKLTYFDNTPIGTLVTRAISDIQTIADVFSQGFLEILGDVLKLLVIITVMFVSDWRLTLISLSTIPVLLVATYIFKNAIKSAFQQVRTQVARLNAFVQEHISGMSIVQIFNREEAEYKKFVSINAAHKAANIKSIWHYSVFFPVVEILSSISIGLLIWVGAKEVLSDKFTIGSIIAFIMYINLLFRPIRQLADRFNTLQMGIVSSERVFKILDTQEVIENKGQLTANNIAGNIEFKKVDFAYQNDTYVLKNISFQVKQGETLALVGATGSGKSSIINLLNRFYEYNSGEILIDGNSIRAYELGSLRQNIGVVLQDVFLFSDSIANNISLNNPSITIEQIEFAAKQVGADNFIKSFPNGYQHKVMERGATLSVGQRQLISFIRAYVYDPKILILDEATSSIDTESELLIQKATEILTKNRTSIIIAHRLSTIQNADRILVLEHGNIIESGTHAELIALNGQYKKLLELQFSEQPV
ncbi:MAG: ABC transporter ATP-binding protein [Bacteroidetes bacterium]|nr:ABC transporter ATP-binding protein [Bacteroidota bacterium]MBK9673248.1 ABC transporter ATP-binding protein [Bacteroidota bacterium]MBK9798455.1 ABC transporter ATP-binding protein [Bacteroidota bacterium]MBP6413561.1 ABC transporter ATP-binding protein [Bacteroidia bacterium]